MTGYHRSRSASAPMRRLKRLFFHLLDPVLAVSAGIVLAILVSGGDLFYIGRLRISAHHASNLITFVLVLGALRGTLGRDVPFLGVKKLDFNRLPERCLDGLMLLRHQLQSLGRRAVGRLLIGALAASAAVKLANSWFYYGFFSGDDVEIHEMTLSRLLAWEGWQAWDLRSAFYPMTFIYPAQYWAHSLGVHDEAALVFTGRVVVVLFSLLNIVLVYQIGRLLYSSVPVGICALFLYAASHLHINFASTVLPRTIAATFILLAVYLLERFPRRAGGVIGAGVALGIGASVRFGEAVLIVCVVVFLLISRRFREALLVGVISAMTIALIVGISDLLYWGSPFFSLRNLIEFTIVHGRSSRGYQPFYFYLVTAGSWANYLVVALAAYAFRLRDWRGIALALLPIGMLSLLPHKEPRYLVAVIPFVCILAGHSFWAFLEVLHHERKLGRARARVLALATILVTLLVGSMLYEIDGYRFRRYESAVDVARYVREQPEASGIALEQVWRAGGQIYLWRLPTVLDISFERSSDRDFVRSLLARPDIQFVALNAGNAERLGYHSLAMELGYRQVPMSKERDYEAYRLYSNRPQGE